MRAAGGFALAALLLAGAAPEPAADLYILAGQSNMSGRSTLDELTRAERATDPAITLYGNDGRWRLAAEPLDTADGQVDEVSADRQAAVGPGMFFARAMRAHRRAALGLLPCAKGGVTISRWQPSDGRDTLYGSCLARVAEAQRPVAGILWYQGESDAERPGEQADQWPRRFRELVIRWRADLGRSDMPVVFVQLSDRPKHNRDRFPSWERVQQLQAGFSMPCVAVVKAAGLAKEPDELHLATAGQRELGKRMAAAMLRLQKKGCR